ncbi:MAG: hypothetical protein CMQ05_09635 [Gammaproteobacteria bacterium]|uniref:Uncharacterized protein n=1 Tax=OM182 bacterium MED-G24 TaxID=1986255 RepID=A0A2A5WXP8_9GAMM|nr:hypothetical protein [Gammaproteobacteria bacterium]PDH40954.1 MAG: hypothetical protein CNE99_02425 [OM182 bacterium MED-G24]RPG26813.1 MAG: hypothetical protein CBC10_002815 [Gammaproteobacteria bacterium TMED50]|tara:strand:+ start:224 stop:421 length:198 start_codon:yes stop_codon:yes gene_type:complete
MAECRTGIFYTKDPKGVVVMRDGARLFRYETIDELIEAHLAGSEAIEREREKIIAAQYLPNNSGI